MELKYKCPYCNNNDFYMLNDKDNKEYYCLINGNIKNRNLDFNNIIPLNVYECKTCKNLIFKSYEN